MERRTTSSTNSDCIGGGSIVLAFSSSFSSWSFRIQISGDGTIENDEAIIVSIVTAAPRLPGTGNDSKVGISSTAGSVTFTIENDDFPTANFATATSNADEDDGTVTVAVNLSENATMNTDVAYIVSGTAASATDFAALSNTLQITSGTKTANLSIPIIDDNTDEPNETIILTLSDGTGYEVGSPKVHTLTINDDDATPRITSDATVDVPEGTTRVLTITATDTDDNDDDLTYSITAGADSARFRINQNLGDLTFKTAPDFETPSSADNDKVYEVEVTASDGTNNIAQTITITVTDENDNTPMITSPATASVVENTTTVLTVTATDADAGTTLIYTVTAGADSVWFRIDQSTGDLTFKTAPDFENPSDQGDNNVYEVIITVSDGTNSVTQIITVTVTDENDNLPMITSPAAASLAENTTTVLTVTATDADAGTILTYAIRGGADRALFSINRTSGALTFQTAPDFENPADQNMDNGYEVEVTASDGTNSDTQTITVTVTNDPSDDPDDDPLGFSEAEEAAVIFPNPSGRYLEVRSATEGTFQLLSLSGKPLLEGSTNTRTDITPLRSGLYLVQLPDGRLLKFVRE